jgi:uncharacterized protein (DUF1501 family)
MSPPITRRTFLTGAAGAGVVGVSAAAAAHNQIGRALGISGSTHPSVAASTSRPVSLRAGKGVLVLVTLYGGNDGLNTVIPYADPAYLAGRSTLGYQPSEVLTLDRQLGLHPNLTGLKSLWDAKQLAVVLGVGYPNPNRSHFRSMDIWQSAVPETDEVTGWLGRWLDLGRDDPMRALSLGPTLPKVMEGAKTAAGAIPSGRLALPGKGRLDAAFASLNAPFPSEGALATRIAQSGTDLLTVVQDVGQILANQPSNAVGSGNLEPAVTAPTTAPPTTTSPGKPAGAPSRPGAAGALAAQLDVVARLIKGGAPTQVYAVSLGGFDTHATEKDNHARLMGELDTGIAGFLKSLDGDPEGDAVVVMTYSEFGRRVAANASGGTDHGTAAPLFVAGRPVKGGFYGEQPSLTDLDQGDLKFSTDFRSIYGTMIEKVLGLDQKSILQGKTFPTLPLV